MLELFQQWGMPQSIRTDNGEPFGVPTRDVIPILSLWLLAWGIKPILNRPRRPQDNATVECNQGTTSRWAEVDNCPNVEILQTRLDEVAVFQRNAYPVRRLKNKTRTEVFKDLQTISRPFDQATFDEQHAYQFLAKAVMPRKVSSSGATSIYNKPFQVGLPFKGNIVFVKFDPNAVGWSILDRNQNLIKTIPDPRFSRENLFNLTVCQ
ncbi:MAG TPA: hypothetical protein PKV93_13615 [Fervidobacterium sp.]|nr:hypothetical protein [Fervidobacterium sp.]